MYPYKMLTVFKKKYKHTHTYMHTKDTNAQKHTPLQHDQFIFNCIV